jgi:hypothetical protein
MNEQLIVKNFGPIKDATVDFKRVTVFIGPTGGGKSTLAKLAAIFSNPLFLLSKIEKRIDYLSELGVDTYLNTNSRFTWLNDIGKIESGPNLDFNVDSENIKSYDDITQKALANAEESIKSVLSFLTDNGGSNGLPKAEKTFGINSTLKAAKLIVEIAESLGSTSAKYFIAERAFVSALTYSWPGFLRDDIGLPKALLFFANSFSASRLTVSELEIPFLNIKYFHQDGQDFIKSADNEILFRLYETASGIQSVTPLLVLLEHLSRNTEQAQSFIIEEPELNLYPTAQQGLLNWLVEKCTQGRNDLTITTHSPYILSSCNLLLEAYKVAQLRPDLEDEIAAIVPKACWLNPDEFAAYYVADGTVKPITDERTHLIGGNELDAVSGDISDSFRKLLRLKKQAA